MSPDHIVETQYGFRCDRCGHGSAVEVTVRLTIAGVPDPEPLAVLDGCTICETGVCMPEWKARQAA